MGMKADGEHAPSLPSAVSGLCACFRAISVRYVSFSEGTPKRKEELKTEVMLDRGGPLMNERVRYRRSKKSCAPARRSGNMRIATGGSGGMSLIN